jgi:hypothetical protein
MCTATAPSSASEKFALVESLLAELAGEDVASGPVAVTAESLRVLERIDAVGTACRARLLAVFDTQQGCVDDGQRTTRTWLVNSLRITKGQAGHYKAIQALADKHPALLAGLRDRVFTTSEALLVARWANAIPEQYRACAEDILAGAARRGADLQGLARLCAEILARTAPPDPDKDPDDDPRLDRSVGLDTTIDGVGVLRGDLTDECAAMVQSVLDALSAPAGGGDLRTQPQRFHDALEEAMRRLLASDLLPKRAGAPVKALAHIHFTDLIAMDKDSVLQESWIADARARWAAHRAAASVGPSDGGAWLTGDAARVIACDAMIVPVVSADLDPAALEDLVRFCVAYDHARRAAAAHPDGPSPDRTSPDGPGPDGPGPDGPGLDGPGPDGAPDAAAAAETLGRLEQQILGRVIQIVSGPGGLASFLRRNLLGKPLAGPSLPLDVGQSGDIPVHLRRLVALRDQGCGYPGGCDQPAARCEPHHVHHRADGGPTSLINLKDYCWWHHHVLLHQLGWTLTVHPDGTSQARSPDGKKTIHSHSPPPRPG